MESTTIFALLSGVIVLGFLSQWFSWWIRVPSIVFLFAGGLIVGPVFGVFTPDALLGDLLFPGVTALIGIILFEGGLTLEFDEIKEVRGPILRIILVGGLITFLLTSLAAYTILSFSPSLSFVSGGILVVTGPTVVIPLLHMVRPKGDVGPVARWEGIIIDPFGAILAVIVFELIVSSTTGMVKGAGFVAWNFAKALIIGCSLGVITAHVLVLLFDWYWIPDYLHNFAILAGVLGAQALSDQLMHEAGLLTVTVMGIYMANQKRATIRHILHFKEDLQVIFISILFVVLVARLEPSFLRDINGSQLLFLGALIVLVRPIAILLSTLGTSLDWADRGFLAWLAPRGIVAAAMASLFAIELEHLGFAQAGQLDDVTFLVIAGTVLVYGLTLQPIASAIGVADANPQGILIIGAQDWSRALADVFQEEGVQVRLIDRNRGFVRKSREQGLKADCADITTESELQSVDIQGIGYCFALTSNEEINKIAMLHALDMGFDRSQVFQVPTSKNVSDQNGGSETLQGRLLFGNQMSYGEVSTRFHEGWTFQVLSVDEEDTLENVLEDHPGPTFPIVGVQDGNDLMIFSEDRDLTVEEGDRLVIFGPDPSREVT